MINNLDNLLKCYDRDVIVLVHLVNLLIENTVQTPTGAIAARLPKNAIALIREIASRPDDAQWLPLAIRDYGPGTSQEFIDAVNRTEMEHSRRGLARWREYFGITAEEKT